MTEITPFGIDISDNPDYDEFAQAVQAAVDAGNGASCAKGDLYNISNQHEELAQAWDIRETSLKTLQNYATVCKSFPKSRRKYKLSFSHYREVCSIRDDKGNPLEFIQDELLQQAVKNEWSRDDMREQVKKTRGREKKRLEYDGTVGHLDMMLIQDYGIAPGTQVKVSVVVEIALDPEQELAKAAGQ